MQEPTYTEQVRGFFFLTLKPNSMKTHHKGMQFYANNQIKFPQKHILFLSVLFTPLKNILPRYNVTH